MSLNRSHAAYFRPQPEGARQQSRPEISPQLVARIERQRNPGRDRLANIATPDVASLHPGYKLQLDRTMQRFMEQEINL